MDKILARKATLFTAGANRLRVGAFYLGFYARRTCLSLGNGSASKLTASTMTH